MRKTLLLKGIRELKTHKIKYILFIIILAMGVSMFNTMFAFMETRELTVDNLYEKSQFMDYHVSFQYGTVLNRTAAENILSDSAVRDVLNDVEYRLIGDVFINHTVDGEQKLTRGQLIGYEYFQKTGQQRDITVNKPLFFDDNPSTFIQPNELSCFLEVGFADAYNFSSEDTLSCIQLGETYDLTIKEIINVPDYFVVRSNDMLFPDPTGLGVFIVPMNTAQRIILGNTNEEIYVNDIIFTIDKTFQTENIETIIIDTFQEQQIPITIVEKEDNPARYQLIEDIEGDKQLMGLFPLIIFSVSGIGLFISLRRMVQSHRPQIGVFKALGVPNRMIYVYFLIIGLIVATAGIILGYFLTFPLNQVFHGLLNQMMIFAEYRYAKAGSYVFISSVITIMLCVLCTLLPSYSAVKAKPIDVIAKQEGVGKTKKQKSKNKILFTKKLPIPFKLVVRDVQRKPFRSFTTIFGVALALAFFLSVVILADSMLIFLDESKQANDWDYEVSMTGFTSIQTREPWLENKDYINSIEYGLRLPVNISHHDAEEEVFLIAVSNLKDTFNVGLDFVEHHGIYLSTYVYENLSLQNGEWVDITIPKITESQEFETKTLTIENLGMHSNPMGFYIYADIDYMYEITNMNGLANVFYIDTSTGRIPMDVQNTIATTPGVSSVTYILDQEKFIDDMFDLILAMIFMMVMISAILMIAIIYNISMINASEKSRDYATMKTLGTSLRRISYLILIEGSINIIGGIAGGSILGYIMAFGMLKSTDLLEGFTFDVIFSFQWFLVGALMVSFVVLIVAWLTLRYIKKIIIADVIRERTTG